MAVKTQLYL